MERFRMGPQERPMRNGRRITTGAGHDTTNVCAAGTYLTTYSLGFAVDTNVAPERLIEMLHRAGFRNFVESHGGFVFTIRADVQGSDGGMFVREAVVQLKQDSRIRFLGWRQL